MRETVENKENEPSGNDFSSKFKEFDKAFGEDSMFGTTNYSDLSKRSGINKGAGIPSDIFFEPDMSKNQVVECTKQPTFFDKVGKLFTRKNEPIDLL